MKRSVLTRYRVMAYVTAVMLLVLSTCMVFKYGFDTGEGITFAVSQAHGVLYIIYLIFAFDLGQKARWPFSKLLWVLLSGTIPFVAFFVERRVTPEITPLVEEYERAEGIGVDGEGAGNGDGDGGPVTGPAETGAEAEAGRA
jgi:integral membrane protein